MGGAAILEASRLREEVKRERARADHAVADAENIMASSSSSSHGLQAQLLEAVAALRQKSQVRVASCKKSQHDRRSGHVVDAVSCVHDPNPWQEVDMLQATVHQECAERTVILEQLNALRIEASLPPLPMADVHAMAKEYMRRNGGVPSASAPTLLSPGSQSTASASRQTRGGSGNRRDSGGDDGGVTLPPLPRLGSRGSVGVDDDGDRHEDVDPAAAAAWMTGKSRGGGSGRGRGGVRGRGR